MTAIRRSLMASLLVLGLIALTTTAVSASGVESPNDPSAGTGGGHPSTPADEDWLGKGSGGYDPIYPSPPQFIAPWERHLVIVHILEGNRAAELDPNSKNPGIVDMSDAIASYQQYATGEIPYIVDVIISVDDEFVSTSWPMLVAGGGGPAGDSVDEYGSIFVGLHNAHNQCYDATVFWSDWGDKSSQAPPSTCEVVLVTYAQPTEAQHKRYAMAAAMDIVVAGWQLHTISVDLGMDVYDPEHAVFDSLLGAKGNSVVTDPLGFKEAVALVVN